MNNTNRGFRLFLKSHRFGGMVPCTNVDRIESGTYSRKHLIYPIIAIVLTWINSFRYLLYLTHFIKMDSFERFLIHSCDICYYIYCAWSRTEFFWSNWRWGKRPKISIIQLYEKCSLQDKEADRFLQLIPGLNIEKRVNRLWRNMSLMALTFPLQNFAFVLANTISDRTTFGITSAMTFSYLLTSRYENELWIFAIACSFGLFLNYFADTGHISVMSSAGFSIMLGFRFKDLKQWLKKKRTENKQIQLQLIQDYYCHLIDLVNLVDLYKQWNYHWLRLCWAFNLSLRSPIWKCSWQRSLDTFFICFLDFWLLFSDAFSLISFNVRQQYGKKGKIGIIEI